MNIPAQLAALEHALVAKGFPAMSSWWVETIARFYATRRRQLVLRVGRRGGKSSTLCRVAVCEALYGEHKIPPGDVGIVGIVSVSRDEANQRLRTIKAILDALGVTYRPIEAGIELDGRPIVFKVFAASISGVVGGTWICAICDEVARWRDADTGANPAREVLGSLRPTLATQPNAKIFLSSSPLGLADAHALAFDAGETTFQCVAFAPSWEANPSITEADTHALEPDDRIWRREYAAIPQAGVLSAFDADLVARAFASPVPTSYQQCQRVLLLDPSAGASDAYAWGIASWRLPPPGTEGRPRLSVETVGGIDQAAAKYTSDQVVGMVAKTARAFHVGIVHSDQFERFGLASAVANHGLGFISHAWTAPKKEAAVSHVRMWLRDGTLALPASERLRKELLAFEERFSPSGALTFKGRGSSHDDYAMLVILASLCDIEGHLHGSPVFEPQRKAQAAKSERIAAALALTPFGLDPPEVAELGLTGERRREFLEMRAWGATVDDALEDPMVAVGRAQQRFRDGGGVERNAQAWEEHLARGDKDT